MSFPSQLVRTLGLAALVALVPAHASAVQPAWQPPTFSYGDGRIDLLEAVRLTLAHDPNLMLDREDVRFRQGVLQELSGAFDWTFTLGASYDYREQQLRDSQIEREKEKRSDLSAQRDFACAEAVRQRQSLENLQRYLGGDPTVEIPNDVRQQVDFIDSLIATEDDPAQRQILQQARTNVLENAIELGTESVGDLDELCVDLGDSLTRLGTVPETEEVAQGRLSLGLSKLFRTGAVFAPFATASYDHNQFVGKRNGFFEDRLDENGDPITTEFGTPLRRFVDFGGKNIEDLFRAEIGFDVNFPLLRGRGVESAGAPERSAAVDLEASEMALRHGAALSALSTTLAYWQLYGTQERVGVLEHSLELQTRLLELTEQLIEGNVIPRVERSRSLAGQAGARAQLAAAQRDLVSARLALARSMGVDVENEENSPLATGPFPETPAVEDVRSLDAGALAGDALELRDDRRATHTLVESGRILAEATRRDLADRFDLGLSLSAGALGEKSFSNAVDRWTGPNGTISVAYEHSIGNNQRLGRLGQAESAVRQRQISAADLDRNIRIGVVQTLRSLEEALARLEAAAEAAARSQETIDAEFEKLKLGASTLIDAILTEQQKTSADLALVGARQQVAALMAQLRFETGTLVETAAEGSRVTLDSLTRLPGGSGGGQP